MYHRVRAGPECFDRHQRISHFPRSFSQRSKQQPLCAFPTKSIFPDPYSLQWVMLSHLNDPLRVPLLRRNRDCWKHLLSFKLWVLCNLHKEQWKMFNPNVLEPRPSRLMVRSASEVKGWTFLESCSHFLGTESLQAQAPFLPAQREEISFAKLPV